MGKAERLRRAGVAVSAGLVLLGPAAVALAAGGTFTGTTAQGDKCGSTFTSPCRVRVNVANRYVGKKGTGESSVQWRARCKSDNKILTGDTAFWGPLNNHHNLTVSGHYTERGLGHGITARDKVTVTVHVGRKVTGTVKDSSVVHQHSHVTNHCRTGTVTFTARR